jgi:hypothetical protein
MSDESWVSRSFDSPHVGLRCDCGWTGTDADVVEWTVQPDSDRAVRNCPDCGRPVLEWGALRGLDGLATIARGPLRAALEAEGLIEE